MGENGSRAIEASIDAIVATDADGRIILWNPAARKMFGYSKEEAASLPVEELMPASYRQKHIEGVKRFLSTGKRVFIGKTIEVEGLRKDGSVFPIELSLSVYETDGRSNFIGVIRDITDRKEIEGELKRQNERLKLVNSELSVLFEISAAAAHSMDLDALLLNVLKAVTSLEVFRLETKGGIFIVEGDRLVLRAHLGHPPDFFKQHSNLKIGECLCGIAAKTGEIVISDDSEHDARHTIRYSEVVRHGHIIVPLKAQEGVAGVLYLYLPPDVPVGAHQKGILSTIGNFLGLVINNSRLYEETKRLTLKDPLTGLANRRLMDVELERNATRSRRYGAAFSVILIDIDHFKRFNDERGHMAGDRLLEDLSRLVSGSIREADLAVRYGGEELLIILPETGLTMAAHLAERLRCLVEANTPVTVSAGVASFSKDMKNIDELIKKADSALYTSKKEGRNQVQMG